MSTNDLPPAIVTAPNAVAAATTPATGPSEDEGSLAASVREAHVAIKKNQRNVSRVAKMLRELETRTSSIERERKVG